MLRWMGEPRPGEIEYSKRSRPRSRLRDMRILFAAIILTLAMAPAWSGSTLSPRRSGGRSQTTVRTNRPSTPKARTPAVKCASCQRDGKGADQARCCGKEIIPGRTSVPCDRQDHWRLPWIRHRSRRSAQARRQGRPHEHAVADDCRSECQGQDRVALLSSDRDERFRSLQVQLKQV